MRNKVIPAVIAMFQMVLPVFSQNPIIPPGVYIADPSAHVWKDGRLYVYGSRDESPEYYCSWNYHVLSTSDLVNWTIHKNSFSSKGPADQVPYSNDYLYAPDVQYRNGTYYLYYCLANNTTTEGVATSASPAGPFVNGKVIKTSGINQIDPCVFIDDDGQGYYIWGQGTAKMALLNPDMVTIDTSSIRDSIVTEKEHRFHEGAYLVKRKGIYYFVYAALSKHDMASCISYATSDNPWGPYRYGGVIINNDHSDPGNWNNHGSLVEFKNQWYVFYHRATHGSYTMRKACIEPIFFNDDGSIDEVEMTTQGATGPLDPRIQMEAERACLLHGNLKIAAFSDGNERITAIENGDRAAYKYFDFNNKTSSVTFRVALGKDPGAIEVAVDRPWAASIATISIPEGGDGEKWTEITVNISPLSGIHAIWLRFSVNGKDGYHVDWFRFN